MGIYEADCEFADPFVAFKGLRRFKQNVSNLGSFMEESSLRITDWQEYEVQIHTDNRPLMTNNICSFRHWEFTCFLFFQVETGSLTTVFAHVFTGQGVCPVAIQLHPGTPLASYFGRYAQSSTELAFLLHSCSLPIQLLPLVSSTVSTTRSVLFLFLI